MATASPYKTLERPSPVNDFLLPVVIGLYILSGVFLVIHLVKNRLLDPKLKFRKVLAGSGNLFTRSMLQIKHLGNARYFGGMLRFYPLTWLLIVIQIVFIKLFTFMPAWKPLDSALILLTGLLAFIIYVNLAKELSFGKKLIAGILSALLTLWYLLLYIYHASSGIFMNFKLIFTNLDLLLYSGSWKVVLSNIPSWGYILLISAVLLTSLAEWKFQLVSSVPEKKSTIKKLALLILLFILFPLLPGSKQMT